MKRGEVLSLAISFALIRAAKVVRGLKKALSDGERHEVAEAAVYEMKKHGDPWKLNDEFERQTGNLGHDPGHVMPKVGK